MTNIIQTVLDDCSYGLYIVTSHDEKKLNGQVSDALMQVSADPPKVAISICKKELTYEYISKSQSFAVSTLSLSSDLPFIGLFGFKSGRDVDKLSQVKYKLGKTQCPLILENTISCFEAKVFDSVDLGSHKLFLGNVIDGEILRRENPLTYKYYKENLKGKTPKNAPSYREQSSKKEENTLYSEKYICDICGYVYDPIKGDPDHGISPGTAFEDIPNDWTCPICGVGKDSFSKM